MSSLGPMSVICLSDGPPAYLKNHLAELHQISVDVAYGRGPVLLSRCCDMFCTSGFADDVLYSRKPNDTMACRV